MILHLEQCVELNIGHTLHLFLLSPNSGQWCIPSKRTSAIGFDTVGFFPTVWAGDNVRFLKVVLEFSWDFYVLTANHQPQFSWFAEALSFKYQAGQNFSYTNPNRQHYKYLADEWWSLNTIAFSNGCWCSISISSYH